MQNTPANAVDNKVAVIPGAISNLGQSIGDLNALIADLRDRLAPVMRPEIPVSSTGGPEKSRTGIDIVDLVDDNTNAVLRACDSIRDMLSRLEI